VLKKRIMTIAVAAAVATLALIGVSTPAFASTQTVGFQAGSWHCTNGVYGISHVDVIGNTTGAPNINASWSGPNNTQRASVQVNGVPGGGGQGHVTVTYHCKVWTIFGWQAGYGEPAIGDRWVYGSGWQPTYTL
jgi:hypothetical protein